MALRPDADGLGGPLGVDPGDPERARIGELEDRGLIEQHGSIIPFDELDHTEHAHELVGGDHGDIPFCVILVHAGPGVGPRLHRHPYAEVFIVESGEAMFRIGDKTVVVAERNVVVSPPGEAHGFTNTGSGELRLVAIHGAPRFSTEWLAGDDPVWTSDPKQG